MSDDLPRVWELRRFTLFGADADESPGRTIAVGVEFPTGPVLATLDAPPVAPVTFADMTELRTAAREYVDGPGGDVWVTYEDPP